MAGMLTLDDLADLQRFLISVPTQWFSIGIQLKLNVEVLEAIRAEHIDPRERLIAMLTCWLKTVERPTWEALIEVLRGEVVGEAMIADVIEKEMLGGKVAKQADDEWTFTPRGEIPKDLASLSEGEKFQLITTLEADTTNIKILFAQLASAILREMSQRRLNAQEVAATLISYDHSLEKQWNRSPYGLSLQCIFNGLSHHWDFFNYPPLKLLISTYGGVHSKSRMDQYESCFKCYCKHRLVILPSNEAEQNVMLVDDKIGSLQWENLRDLQTQASQAAGVKIDALFSLTQPEIGGTEFKEIAMFQGAPSSPKKVKLEEQDCTTAESESIELSELRGVHKINEMRVLVTNSPQLIQWQGYGLKLHIPQNSLPSDVDSCTITIEVSLSGQYQFPSNTELVSPVVWLRCDPCCKFNVPLSLEIQHCAPLKNSFRLFMARASCTQKDLPYSFKVLHGGVFVESSPYGIIDLKHFCGVSVVQEKSDQRRYWSNVFYMGPPSNRDIHFTVTWHDDAHINTVKKEYALKKALPGPEQSVMFKGNRITLGIPRKGEVICNEWKVFPAIPPKILKKEVDEHTNCLTVPHCELVAKWIKKDQQLKALEYIVDILGTTEEENYFTINIDPASSGEPLSGMLRYQDSSPEFQAYVSSLPPSAYPYLKLLVDEGNNGVEKDLIAIADEMLDWEEKLTTHFELTNVDLSDIKGGIDTPVLKRREVLRRWKNNQGLNATYGNLLDLFVRARHTKCARVVCGILKQKGFNA